MFADGHCTLRGRCTLVLFTFQSHLIETGDPLLPKQTCNPALFRHQDNVRKIILGYCEICDDHSQPLHIVKSVKNIIVISFFSLFSCVLLKNLFLQVRLMNSFFNIISFIEHFW